MGSATGSLLLLFIPIVIATAVKLYVFLQRFKSLAIVIPLEPIVIVVNGSPFSAIVREYCTTHRAEDPAVVRDTMNDWKSSPAKGLTSGADGGPRTQGEIYNINYSACCTLARNLIFKRLPYLTYKN